MPFEFHPTHFIATHTTVDPAAARRLQLQLQNRNEGDGGGGGGAADGVELKAEQPTKTNTVYVAYAHIVRIDRNTRQYSTDDDDLTDVVELEMTNGKIIKFKGDKGNWETFITAYTAFLSRP